MDAVETVLHGLRREVWIPSGSAMVGESPPVRAPAGLTGVHLLINFIAFQVGWFACVLGGAHQLPWLGAAVVPIVVAIHLAVAARPLDEAMLIGSAAVLGFVWDSALVAAGLLIYPSGVLLPGIAPYWIGAMWINFATTLNVTLRWLKGRWRLAGIFGAFGGPLAYYAGAKLGAVSFSNDVTALVTLGLGWAFLFPVLMGLAARFNGIDPAPLRPQAV